MTTPPHGAGREAGGPPLGAPVTGGAPATGGARQRRFQARLRAAGHAAPRWYAGAVLALGGFAAAALVTVPAGAGLAALGVALCGLGAALAMRGSRARGDTAYRAALLLLAAALAAVPAVRSAWWVCEPSVVGAAMLASLAAAGGHSGRQVVAGLTLALRRPLAGTAAVLAPLGRTAGRADGSRLRPALRGGLLAAALLAVFVPLFTAADAAFAEIVDSALPSGVDVEAPAGRALALLAVVALGGALAVARAAGPASPGAPVRRRLARAEWLLPLASLVALFAAFVAVQLAVLFGGHDHVLRTAGLSYAEYAHQGYGQLMAAAVLTLAVIAGAWRWARRDGRRDERLLSALLVALCALCLIVLASALKRLGLYEQAYGYTRLRLLADANILWLGAVLVLVVAALVSGRARWLARAIVLVSATGAVAFAATNPDGRIASRNVDRYLEAGQIDGYYLSTLSADAAPALTRLRYPECLVGAIRRDLRPRDGVLGANVDRSRARRALAGLPPAPHRGCPY